MLEPWVTQSALLPAVGSSLSLHECGAAGSASGRTACPIRPTLHQSWSRHSHTSPLCPGARLRPSYQSGCMFLFYRLGVGLPCHSIFCQFWLCKEAQCVYLHCHLGSPPQEFSIRSLRLYFLALEPWVEWSVSLPCCSFWFICTRMWDSPDLQPLPLPVRRLLPTWL